MFKMLILRCQHGYTCFNEDRSRAYEKLNLLAGYLEKRFYFRFLTLLHIVKYNFYV